MLAIADFNRLGKELEERLQLRTAPFAVRLLRSEAEIPAGAIRPKRERGAHLGLCQAFAMARREGKTVAMLKEDNWCYIPVLAFGLAAAPEFFLEGQADCPDKVADPVAAKRLAAAYPRLEAGKYAGTVSAPLKSAAFEPDLAVIYCNAGQLRCLLVGLKWQSGELVTSTLEPSGACVLSTVPALLTGECQVSVPCGGDRRRAFAQDDEMIFTVPAAKLEAVVAGLRHLDESRGGYAQTLAPDPGGTMEPEFRLGKAYIKMGHLLDMEMRD